MANLDDKAGSSRVLEGDDHVGNDIYEEARGGNDDGANEGAEQATVRAVRLSIPPISEKNIELWFVQLDHWFIANDVRSDAQRFSTVVASMPNSMLQQVYDSVVNAPRENKYKSLKNAVVANYRDSEQRRIQQLVSGLQLGDQKPSHLLSQLRRAGGDAQDETLLRGLWFQRLPMQVRTCLSTVGVEQPIAKLAEIADTVMETFRVGDTNHLNAVSEVNAVNERVTTSNARTVAANESQLLREEIKNLARLVRDLVHVRGRSTERSPSRNRKRSPSSSRQRQGDSMCWYHAKHGSAATNCRGNCTHPDAKN